MNFDKVFSRFQKRRKRMNKYTTYNTLCLAGIVLVVFYAIINFPGYYEGGLDTQEWVRICLVMISGIVLLYMQRGCSSKEGARPHDYNTSGGTMHAFFFEQKVCTKCGTKLILAQKGNDPKLKYAAPGNAMEDNSEPVLYCCKCEETFDIHNVLNKNFKSSKISAFKFAGLGLTLKGKKAYKISGQYIKAHALTTLLTFIAVLPSFYFARKAPLRLILPAVVGYFFFVSVFNLLNYISARYYVVEAGVVQKSLWSYSFYPIDDTVCFVKYDVDNDANAWGLITNGENLFISSMITDSNSLVKELFQLCSSHLVPIISD